MRLHVSSAAQSLSSRHTPVTTPGSGKHETKPPGRLSRWLESFFTWLTARYDDGLTAALRHRFLTLLTFFGTVALTGYLFWTIPKGFFPQQDTGLIVGISEAAQDVSPEGMKQRQQAILGIIMKDPAVADVAGYIGPGGPTVTEKVHSSIRGIQLIDCIWVGSSISARMVTW